MTDLFCGFDCDLADLALFDWLLLILVLVLCFALTRWARVWVFSLNTHPQNSWRWHWPRLSFFALVMSLTSIPAVGFLLGGRAASIFAQLILPELVLIIYFLWYVSRPD